MLSSGIPAAREILTPARRNRDAAPDPGACSAESEETMIHTLYEILDSPKQEIGYSRRDVTKYR
jgi:hypothetical protein